MPHRLVPLIDWVSVNIMGSILLFSYINAETLKNISIALGILWHLLKFGEWGYNKYKQFKQNKKDNG